jgi:type I restriction enzyme R subunit
MGSVVQLIKSFGGKDGFDHAVRELQSAIYRDIA